MGRFPSPLPSPPSPPPDSGVPILYYGLFVVGTAAIILAMYNLMIIKWCTEHNRHSRPAGHMVRTHEPASRRSFDNPSIHLVSSFKFKKGQGVAQDKDYDYECPVCLSVFEEGEEVRQLPRCNHSFHAPCIDMWLYSHFDCPVCRSLVEPPVLLRHMMAEQPEHSREGLLNIGISV